METVEVPQPPDPIGEPGTSGDPGIVEPPTAPDVTPNPEPDTDNGDDDNGENGDEAEGTE